MSDQLGEPQIKGNRNLIDAACETAGAIGLFISREIAPLRNRIDKLERRLRMARPCGLASSKWRAK
jgi:hypothetical protein